MVCNTSTTFRSLTVLFCKRFFPLLFLGLLFFSCATTTPVQNEPAAVFLPQTIEWVRVNNYASLLSFRNKNYPVIWHCLKIDLKNSSLKVHAFPSEDFNGPAGITARTFARKSKADILINTSPYRRKYFIPQSIVGIHKTDGIVYSKSAHQYSAFALEKLTGGTLKGSVIEKQNDEEFKDSQWAFGGFFTILKDGIKKEFNYESKDSRTAVGFSQDGQTMYLLAVEGERRFQSSGLSYPDCAEILLALGAYDALEMDGGGSTALFINGKNKLSYPSLRKNAAWFGFSSNAN